MLHWEFNVTCGSVMSKHSPRKWLQCLMLTVRARLGLRWAQPEIEQKSWAQQAGGSGLLNSTVQRLHIAYQIARPGNLIRLNSTLTLHSSWFKPATPDKATITVCLWPKHAPQWFQLAEVGTGFPRDGDHSRMSGVAWGSGQTGTFPPSILHNVLVVTLQTFCSQDSAVRGANISAAAFSRVTFKYYLTDPVSTGTDWKTSTYN